MLLDQAAQRLDGGVGRRERHRAGAGAAGGEPRHLDRDQRQQPAHGEPEALAREEALVVQVGAQRSSRLISLAWPSGTTGSAASAFRRLSASPERSPSAAAHVLGEAHHPAVGRLCGWKRKPCATVGGTRIAAGAANGERRRLEGHLAAAALDQQDLEQIAMAVRADQPVVHRGARRDRLDVDEVERLIVRRIAVEMKQRQCRDSGHGARIGEWHGAGNAPEEMRVKPWDNSVEKRNPAASGGASRSQQSG